MLFKHTKLVIAISMATIASNALADPCSKSVDSGGQVNLYAKVEIGLWSFLTSGTEDYQREIAKNLQDTYGFNVANDYADGQLRVHVVEEDGQSYMPILIPYDGSTSIEKAWLNAKNIDTDEPDPNPCTAPGEEEEDSNANTSSGGGGGSGYTGPMPSINVPQPFIADQVWNWHQDNPSGSVSVTQAPGSASSFDYSSYYASYYSNYYSNYNANYYANYNPN